MHSPQIIQNKYRLKQCIGQGKFGKVFLGQNIYTDSLVAIKIETKDISLLKREATFLRYLQDKGAAKYIPTLLWFGVIPDAQPCLVMTYCNGGALTYCSNQIMQQCISGLEVIHNLQVVHRDIKPQNFMFSGQGTTTQIKLIDFGLADFYREEDQEPRDTILGTPRYASIFVHLGMPHTYRDDLISLVYMFLHLNTHGEYPHRPMDNSAHESIHHPVNIEIACGKKLESLYKCGYTNAMKLLEQLYDKTSSIDYTAAKKWFA